MNYKSFTEPYLDSLGPFGDVIVSMLATIAAQNLVKISENTKAALANKKAAGVQLSIPDSRRRPHQASEAPHLLDEGGASNQAIGRTLENGGQVFSALS